MVEGFPGRGVHGEVTDEAHGTIGEAFANIEDATIGVIGRLVGAFWRGISDIRQTDTRPDTLQASLGTDPLETLPLAIEAIGRESVAKRAHRTAVVIVTPQRPGGFVLIGLVTALGYDPSRVQVGLGRMQENLVTQARITRDGLDH